MCGLHRSSAQDSATRMRTRGWVLPRTTPFWRMKSGKGESTKYSADVELCQSISKDVDAGLRIVISNVQRVTAQNLHSQRCPDPSPHLLPLIPQIPMLQSRRPHRPSYHRHSHRLALPFVQSQSLQPLHLVASLTSLSS